jgi:hypothetical protein
MKCKISNEEIIKKKNGKLGDLVSCLEIKKNCKNSKTKAINSLKKIKKDSKKICGYAATVKSTTVLNYCYLNTDTLDFTYLFTLNLEEETFSKEKKFLNKDAEWFSHVT